MNLAPGVLEALKRYDAPTLANAIETFGLRPFTEGFTDATVRCIFPELPRIAGYAVTARMTSRRAPADASAQGAGNRSLYEHTQMQPSPRIVVVQDLDAPDCSGSLWGEVHGTIFTALGCAGVVTDGIVRDLPEVRDIGFSYFASGVGVSHAYAVVHEVGCEVRVGGLTVRPGDLLFGDMHGVLSVPIDVAPQLPRVADELHARERRMIAWARSREFDAAQIGRLGPAETEH